MRIKLGELLVEAKLISPDQLQRALTIQSPSGQRLGTILLKLGYISEDTLVDFLAKQNNYFTTTDYIKIEDAAINILPKYLCKKFNAVPLGFSESILMVAMIDPSDQFAIVSIEEYTNTTIRPMLVSNSRLQEALQLVPYSYRDLFNQDNLKMFGVGAAALLMIMFIITGVFYSRMVHTVKYGETTLNLDGTKTYQNLNLILEISPAGKYKLLGRGAHADGTFNMEFDNRDDLESYLKARQNLFSPDQIAYIKGIKR